MTLQEIYDKVACHLLTQNKRATSHPDGEGRCMYRAPDGLKCAAGCLIPDELYDPLLEGVSWNAEKGGVDGPPRVALMVELRRKLGLDEPLTVSLVTQLQAIHDHRRPALWPGDLANVAATYSLTPHTSHTSPPARAA